MGWNVSITLFYFTCVQGLAKIIVLDAKSKPWSLGPRRWQFWHVWRVQSRGATFFALVKRGNLCWLSWALFIYTEKIGPNGLLRNGFHKRHLSSVPVIVCVVWIITKLLAIWSKPVSTVIRSAEFHQETSLSCPVAHGRIALPVQVFLRGSVTRELLVLGNSSPFCWPVMAVPHHVVYQSKHAYSVAWLWKQLLSCSTLIS